MGEVVEFPQKRRVSWTELNTYRQCPHKWWLQYHEKWRTDRVAKPLAIGILWHEVLDLHYTGIKEEGAPFLDAILQLLTDRGAKDRDHPEYEIAAKVVWMYDGYRKKYGDREREWKIIQSESEMEFELPVYIDGIEFLLRGRIDLIIEMNKLLWIVDHKSGKDLPTNKELDLDDQMPIYIMGLREMGIPVKGALFNNAKTFQTKRLQSLDERFSRVWTFRTDAELDTVRHEAVEDLTTAYREDVPWPRHPDTQTCKWRCQYLEPCLGGRKASHLEVQLLEAKGFAQP